MVPVLQGFSKGILIRIGKSIGRFLPPLYFCGVFMEFIQWTDKLSLNIKLMDKQHKRLFKMINDLSKMITNNKESEVQRILSGLKEYTLTHFKEEENLFRKSEYPDYEKHIKEHGFFIAKLDNFNSETNRESKLLSLEVLGFLKNWLFYHIAIIDSSYSSYVLANSN